MFVLFILLVILQEYYTCRFQSGHRMLLRFCTNKIKTFIPLYIRSSPVSLENNWDLGSCLGID